MIEGGCDLCGSNDAAEIGIARDYTNDQPLHVCKDCGLVYVRHRRSEKEIARDWDSRPGDELYSASLAATEARHSFVARFAQRYFGKKVCDIGAADGRFLKLLNHLYGIKGVGVTPCREESESMKEDGIACFEGTATEYTGTGFDSATLLWTLENTSSCKATLQAARNIAKNGHVIVATGSRLHVPFKKPLGDYLGKSPLDLHSWRFSHRTLDALMRANAIEPVLVNRYRDSDYLVMVGKPVDEPLPWRGDDYRQVLKFFRKWHWATKDYDTR